MIIGFVIHLTQVVVFFYFLYFFSQARGPGVSLHGSNMYGHSHGGVLSFFYCFPIVSLFSAICSRGGKMPSH